MPKQLPKLDIPLLRELYSPDFDPLDLPINRRSGVQKPEERVAEVEKKVKDVEARLFSGETPAPLTKEEAEVVERRVDELRTAIAETRRRIAGVRSNIEKQAVPEGQPEVSFTVDLKRKGNLRRAVKKVFGIKPETLSYSMYIAALEAKRQIEESEAKDYAAGDWED